MNTSRLIVLTCAVALTAAAHAQTPLISDRDNTLYETADGSLSNGAGNHVFMGRSSQPVNSIRRGLLRFPMNDPDSCLIQGVTLQVTVSQTSSGPATVSLHRVLRPWGEGTSQATGNEGGGAPSQPDDATWIHTFYDTSFWSQPGGDYDPVPSATFTLDTLGTYVINTATTSPQFPGMVEDVQFWQAFPDSNFGWMFIGDESVPATTKRINAGTHPDPAVRSILTLYGPCDDCFCFYQGDINANGSVDAVDLNQLIDILFFSGLGPKDPQCPFYRADWNGDGFTDAVDLNICINHLFFGGPSPCDPCSGNGACVE
jgi:hypothetical protein